MVIYHILGLGIYGLLISLLPLEVQQLAAGLGSAFTLCS